MHGGGQHGGCPLVGGPGGPPAAGWANISERNIGAATNNATSVILMILFFMQVVLIAIEGQKYIFIFY
jgi:hypothetical protein